MNYVRNLWKRGLWKRVGPGLLLPAAVLGLVAVAVQTAQGQTEIVLYNFCSQPNCADGANPEFEALVLDKKGNLYGTTISGGASNAGAVFELTPSGIEAILYSFVASGDGWGPAVGLAHENGNLYGATVVGGPYGGGTVFELSPPTKKSDVWTETVLWNFGQGTDGSQPYATLVRGVKGNLYGTTLFGGAYGHGTVFELSPPTRKGGVWAETILWSLGNGTDGEGPFSRLVFDKEGNLYGTTYWGGAFGYGTVFELTPAGGAWSETVLHSFNENGDGIYPFAGLILGKKGNLYGTTASGGNCSCGTVFELTPTGTR